MNTNKKHRIAFAFIIEYGDLENKVLLLGTSLRRVFPEPDKCPIYAVRPRVGKEIKNETLTGLRELGIEYIYKPVNKKWKNLPFSNEAYGSALVEERVKDSAEILVYLDSDIICLRLPDELLFDSDTDIALTPIDTSSACGLKFSEELNKYWKFAYDLANVNRNNIWSVKTKVDELEIYPCFNSGLVAVRPELGVFRKWRDTFDHSIDKGYFAEFSPISREFFNTDQAFLASTVLSMIPRKKIKILDNGYNFPLNFLDHFAKNGKIELKGINLLHYHRSFYDLDWMNYFEIDDETKDWLVSLLPLPLDYRSSVFASKLETGRQMIMHYYWKVRMMAKRVKSVFF